MKWKHLMLACALITALFIWLAWQFPPDGKASAQRSAIFRVTAYCLQGRTASGYYTRPGVVAVDPRIIRLRTPVSVAGYGRATALDTGSAIRGYRIDVWFSSCSTARRWGSQMRRVWW